MAYYLYETLKPFGYNSATVNDLCNSHLNKPGKQFFSSTHVLTIDRNYLIIGVLKNEQKSTQTDRKILLSDQSILEPAPIAFNLLDAPVQIEKRANFAYLDADKLSFPLTIRKWQPGDVFRPFGMKGMKKLSDFLIDIKMSLPKKATQMVLISGNDIVWVVGQRIDDRYAVKDSTKKVYFAELKHSN